MMDLFFRICIYSKKQIYKNRLLSKQFLLLLKKESHNIKDRVIDIL